MTGIPFEDGEEVISVISADAGGDAFLRIDRHHDAVWNPDDHPPAFSQWRSIHVPPPDRTGPRPKLHDHPAENLLRDLLDSGDDSKDQVRYVLALMLERQKRLRQIHEERLRDGSRILIYEHVQTAETFLIRDPEFRLDEIETVQAEIVGLLDTLGNPAPASVDGEPVEEEALEEEQGEQQAENRPSEGTEDRRRT